MTSHDILGHLLTVAEGIIGIIRRNKNIVMRMAGAFNCLPFQFFFFKTVSHDHFTFIMKPGEMCCILFTGILKFYVSILGQL